MLHVVMLEYQCSSHIELYGMVSLLTNGARAPHAIIITRLLRI
jgi:hypothetical protein